MLLSEVDNMSRLVHRFTQVIDIKVLAFINNEEFTEATHKSFVVRLCCAASSFRIEVK
jgi:hypothetical protein